jgi:2'-5' RNA ligase
MQLSLLLEETITAQLDHLRKQFYPKHLNKNKAHLTLIYKLDEVHTHLIEQVKEMLKTTMVFQVHVENIQQNKYGNQINVSSEALLTLHNQLKDIIGIHIFRKDKAIFVPHITIQNGVTNYKAVRSNEQIKTLIPQGPYKAVGVACKYATPTFINEIVLFKN